MELVTGYHGKNHVTAAQIADFNRGIFGKSAILDVGNKLEASIQTANEIVIKDGVAMFDGREVYVAYGKNETVNIVSGTQGMKRNDIIVVKYERELGTKIEKVTLKVINGTPDKANPSDPKVSNIDIRTGASVSEKPLYRVRLNGTAIEGIDRLVEIKGFKKHNFADPVKSLAEAKEGYALDAVMGKELKKQIDAKCASATMGGYRREWLLTNEWVATGNYDGFEGEDENYKGVRGSDGYIEIKTPGIYLIMLQANIVKKTYAESGNIWSKITMNDASIGGDVHFMTDGVYYDTLKFVTYNYLSAGTKLKAYLSVDSSLTDVWSQGEEYLNIIKLS